MPISIDSTLKKISRQTEEAAAVQLASRLGVSYAALVDYPFNIEVLSLVPLSIVENELIAAYIRSAHKIRVAVVHAEKPEVIQRIEQLAAQWKVEVEQTVVSATSMHFLIDEYRRLLAEKKENEKRHAQEAALSEQKNYYKHVQTLEDLQTAVETVSVSELIDVILAAAINQQASDIHFEPGGDQVTVRFRIDGILEKVLSLSSAHYGQLVSRVKLLSSIKLDEHSTIQDGRFSLSNKGVGADIRVSVIPTGYGEGIVMRVLRQDSQALTIADLGFSDYNRQLIEKAVRKPYGLILVTGPTGSGKSSTLYALLQLLNTTEKKVITLEDPIEYRIKGIQQSQIDNERGFTFAEGLRGVLRQDPDIVMVGEIRDPETATIALNASLTGHLVLSTLHTNNAVTVHTRFLQMGIAPFLLTGSIQLIIAQRLVRRLVPGSTPEKPAYKGRLVISEVLCPNQEFEQAVIANADQVTLEEITVRGGMLPMVQDGLQKVKEGVTTEAEVYRVTAEI